MNTGLTVGRFLQEDVYRGDGLNLYAYCRNNPVIYYDPSGYHNKDGAKGKQSTVDLNDAIGRIGQYCDWTITNGAFGEKEEYFPGPNGNRTGSHRTDLTMQKEIDGQKVTVRVNTTTDARGNIPDTRERKNAYELDGQIQAENIRLGEADSLNHIVTISKTDGKINNVDYTNITQRTDPFNQNFHNPKVANEMKKLQNELNNLAAERADGKTSAQIAAEYKQKKSRSWHGRRSKNKNRVMAANNNKLKVLKYSD